MIEVLLSADGLRSAGTRGKLEEVAGGATVGEITHINLQTPSAKIICDTGPKTSRLSFSDFLLNHSLHCICFIILFTVSRYLVSN